MLVKVPINIQGFFPGEGFSPNSIGPLYIEHLIEGVKHGLIVEMF